MNGFIKLTNENGKTALVNLSLVQYISQGKRFSNIALQGKPDMLVQESAQDVEKIIRGTYIDAIIHDDAKPETAGDSSAKVSKGKGK